MLFTYRYLAGLQYHDLSTFPGVYETNHPTKAGSYYFISSYSNFKTRKQAFFDFMSRHGQPEIKRSWELHHVVEKQHLEALFEPADLAFAYNYLWPVVLIHKDEHTAYNSLLHIKETPLLYGVKPGKITPKVRQDTIANIGALYRDTYRSNHVLSVIAANVVKDLKY